MSLNIQVTRTQHPKEKPDPNHLGFGDFFTDHMFVMNYTEGQGWHDPRIIPYAPISLEPAAMVFHYAQEMFGTGWTRSFVPAGQEYRESEQLQ